MPDSTVGGVRSENAARHSGAAPGVLKRVHPSLRSWVAIIAWVGLLFFSLGQFAGAFQKEQKPPAARAVLAEKFDLIGANGKLAASLHTGANGAALLTFFDDKGQRRLDIGLSPNGQSGIEILDTNGQAKLNLMITANDQKPHIMLNNGPGGSSIELSISDKDYPHLSISRPGQGQVLMGIPDDEPPYIILSEKHNDPRMMLSTKTGISLLEGGATRANWQLLDDGSPGFFVRDRQGKTRFSITVDKDGKPIMQSGLAPKP